MADVSADIVKRWFRRFDVNGDGMVTKEELQMLLKEIDSSAWTDETLEALFLAVDVNADNKISCTEFTNWAFGSESEGQDIKRQLFDNMHTDAMISFETAPVLLRCGGNQMDQEYMCRNETTIILYVDGRALVTIGETDLYCHSPFFDFTHYSGVWEEVVSTDPISTDSKQEFNVRLDRRVKVGRETFAVEVMTDPNTKLEACEVSFTLADSDGNVCITDLKGARSAVPLSKY